MFQHTGVRVGPPLSISLSRHVLFLALTSLDNRTYSSSALMAASVNLTRTTLFFVVEVEVDVDDGVAAAAVDSVGSCSPPPPFPAAVAFCSSDWDRDQDLADDEGLLLRETRSMPPPLLLL